MRYLRLNRDGRRLFVALHIRLLTAAFEAETEHACYPSERMAA